jgi:hypothetical protein
MILLAYILWIALAAFASRWIGRRVRGGRTMRAVIGSTVFLVIVLVPYWDVLLGLPVMIDTCRKRAGLQIHENVHLPINSVVIAEDGGPISVCVACYELPARGLATEVQAAIAAPTRRSEIEPAFLVSRPGPARYWLSHRGDPKCALFFDVFARDEQAHRKFWITKGRNYDPDACIAAESIPEITAPYRLTSNQGTRRIGRVTMKFHEAELVRQVDGTRTASLAQIRQVPWTERRFNFGLPPVLSCASRMPRNVLTGDHLGWAFGVDQLLMQIAEAQRTKRDAG